MFSVTSALASSESTLVNRNQTMLNVEEQQIPSTSNSITNDSVLLVDSAITEVDDSTIVPVNTVTLQSNPIALKSGIPHNSNFDDFLIFAIVLMVAIFASVKVTYPKYLTQIFGSFFSNKAASRLFKEHFSSTFNASFRLELLFYLSASVLLYIILRYVQIELPLPNIVTYGLCIVAVVLFYGGKNTAYRFTGWIFNISNEVKEYIFYNKILHKVAGIALVPIVACSFIHDEIVRLIVLISGVFIVVFTYIFSILKGFLIIGKKHVSYYYLILYLCTLEILPFLLVWKMLIK